MKKYRVIFHLTKSVDYEVEAENEEMADDKASEWFNKEYGREVEGGLNVDDVEVEEIEN